MTDSAPPTSGVTTPPTYCPPRAAATKYTVYPTGYDQSPFSDAYSFCVYVEQYLDTGRWRVHDGFTHGEVLTHNGTWTRDRPQVRRFTRFDTAEQAIEVALIGVDTRRSRNLVEWIESSRGREIAAAKRLGGEV